MSDPIDDILNRQRDRAKQKRQQQEDAEAKLRDQAGLAELWNSVHYFPGNDAHEWMARICALTLALDERGLMGRLNEPPAGLGGWDGNEPDAYHLAVAIYRQSLRDHHKAVGLLLEAAKLRETTWPRVDMWLRRELREHVEGRWAANHAPPKKPISPDEFLTSKPADTVAELLAHCGGLQKRINGDSHAAKAAAFADAPSIIEKLWKSMYALADNADVPPKPDNVQRITFADCILTDEETGRGASGKIRVFNAAIETVVGWCKEKQAAKSEPPIMSLPKLLESAEKRRGQIDLSGGNTIKLCALASDLAWLWESMAATGRTLPPRPAVVGPDWRLLAPIMEGQALEGLRAEDVFDAYNLIIEFCEKRIKETESMGNTKPGGPVQGPAVNAERNGQSAGRRGRPRRTPLTQERQKKIADDWYRFFDDGSHKEHKDDGTAKQQYCKQFNVDPDDLEAALRQNRRKRTGT